MHQIHPPDFAGQHRQRRGREAGPRGPLRACCRGRRGVLLKELGRGELMEICDMMVESV